MDAGEFREALANWASGVTIAAFRDDTRVVATTVSAFMSLTLEPPLVLIALGPNATILPYLQVGEPFGISILSESQRQLATTFADSYAVGPSPFPADGTPIVAGALVGLGCTVHSLAAGGDHRLVTAAVDRITRGPGDRPLVRFRRRYRGLDS